MTGLIHLPIYVQWASVCKHSIDSVLRMYLIDYICIVFPVLYCLEYFVADFFDVRKCERLPELSKRTTPLCDVIFLYSVVFLSQCVFSILKSDRG